MKAKKVRLANVAKFIRGITFKPNDIVSLNALDAVVCMRTKNIQPYLDENDLIAVPSKFAKRQEQYIHEGDILVSTANSWDLVGKCCWVNKLNYSAVAGGFISILRTTSPDVHSRYLYYFFSSPLIQHVIRHCGKQTTNISNLDCERCLTIEIPLPPLPEQRRIAVILDKADAIRRKRKQTIELCDQFLRSVFLDMFGDPVKNPKGFKVVKLSQVYTKKKAGTKCGPFGSALKKHEHVDSGIPAWTMDNIKNDRFIEQGCLYITKEKYHELASYAVETGDIIISRAGTVGKMCVVTTSVNESIISTNLIRLSLDRHQIEPLYFTSLMTYCKGRVGILRKGTDGAYSFMNTGILDKLDIPLPPLEVQKDFVKVNSQIKKIQSLLQSSLQEMNNQFHSLVQKAFRGEL